MGCVNVYLLRLCLIYHFEGNFHLSLPVTSAFYCRICTSANVLTDTVGSTEFLRIRAAPFEDRLLGIFWTDVLLLAGRLRIVIKRRDLNQ